MANRFDKGKSVETRKRKSREIYGKRKKDNQVEHGCPTPMKTPYRDFEGAVYSINRGGNAGKRWGTYQCVCGWWHVTSRPGKLLREFDDEFYRSDNYTYVPYNRSTYQSDKEEWNARKSGED